MFMDLDQEQLVEKVTKELLRRLGSDALSPPRKPLLATGHCAELNGADVVYIEKGDAPDWGAYSGVAIPSLSENQLVLASFGLKFGLESAAIVDALLVGLPVCVAEEGVAWRYSACPESSLGRLYAAAEQKLRSFGVRFVRASKLAEQASECDVRPAAAPVQVSATGVECVDARAKKVLSERDLRDLCGAECGELLVSTGAIITPLGVDWLRLRGIVVRREGAK